MTKSRRVLVFGTFDLFHPGHRSFLRQAKRLGRTLVVAVGRDANVAKLKNRKPVHAEAERLATVRKLPIVDEAILASKDPSQRFSLIRRLKPDIIALGYDQRHYAVNLEAELRLHGIACEVVRLRPYKPSRYKTSLIRRNLARRRKT